MSLMLRAAATRSMLTPPVTYATWNPANSGTNAVLSNANLSWQGSNYQYTQARSTVAVASGKCYWEITTVSGGDLLLGVCNASYPTNNSYPGSDVYAVTYYQANGERYINGGSVAYGTPFTGAGVVLGFALDATGRTLEVFRNNVSQGVMFNAGNGLPTGALMAVVGTLTGSTLQKVTANFGATPFTYTPPAGYNAGLY